MDYSYDNKLEKFFMNHDRDMIWYPTVLQARKMQESGWKPRWFAKDKGSDTYRYLGGYWESREKSNWEGCPDIFGQLPNDLMITD